MKDRLETGAWSQGKAAPRVGGIPGAFPKPGSPSFPFSGGGAFLANVSVSRAACSAFSAISPPPLCPAVLQGAPRQLQARAYPGPFPWCGAGLGNSQRTLGGAAWDSLGPRGTVPRVSFESAVVARGGSAGFGTLISFILAGGSNQTSGSAWKELDLPAGAAASLPGTPFALQSLMSFCAPLFLTPCLLVRLRTGAPFATLVSPSLCLSSLERSRR